MEKGQQIIENLNSGMRNKMSTLERKFKKEKKKPSAFFESIFSNLGEGAKKMMSGRKNCIFDIWFLVF